MSCGNQPAHISVIIVAAFPSVDGMAAQSKIKGKSASRRKVKGITIIPKLTCHSISAGGKRVSAQPPVLGIPVPPAPEGRSELSPQILLLEFNPMPFQKANVFILE